MVGATGAAVNHLAQDGTRLAYGSARERGLPHGEPGQLGRAGAGARRLT